MKDRERRKLDRPPDCVCFVGLRFKDKGKRKQLTVPFVKNQSKEQNERDTEAINPVINTQITTVTLNTLM
jgi:hypothetical protein